jgi:alkylated DNA repair dioxygenase AlkB
LNFNQSYRNGKDSIHYHRDKEALDEGCQTIASISLGETRRFLLKNIDNPKNVKEFRLTCGSLLVMAGKTQHFWKHSVPKELKVSGARINLTFRQIKKE